MSAIEILDTGLIYRNPQPHVRTVHAIFPSVVCTDAGDMVATFALAEAFEAVNAHTHFSRSPDRGESWELAGELYERQPLTSDAARITLLPNGEIVALVCEHDRAEHPNEGLTNPENIGFVPTKFSILRSPDQGHSWSAPQPIEPPLVGPSFELCSPIVPLTDGRWLLPTSTLRGWDGAEPNGMKMVAFVSHDQGSTWPEYMDVMNDPAGNIVYC